MKLQFLTLDNKKYYTKLDNHKCLPWRRVTNFQLRWKTFFLQWMPNDLWYEEFPVRPYLSSRYRIDLLDLSRRVAIECHGDQHVSVSNYFHSGDKSIFYEHLRRDREKELWCEKNRFYHISVYTTTPFDKEFFKNTYPSIKWK